MLRKSLLILLALLLVLPHIVLAESLDVAAMTDEELRNIHDQVQAEIDRRAEEARAAALLREDDAEGEIVYEIEEGRSPKIFFASEEQLRNRLHKVTLTLDNWNQYLGDYYCPTEYVRINNFGEVTMIEEGRAVGFHFKSGYVGQYVDTAVKFSGKSSYRMEGEWDENNVHYQFTEDVWTESDEVYTADLYIDGRRDVNLEKYECLAVTGTLYVLEVAPELSEYLLSSYNQLSSAYVYVDGKSVTHTQDMKDLYDRLNP